MNPAAPFETALSLVWTPCPVCWGQRRVFVEAVGEGYVPETCAPCLGVGEMLTGAAAAALRSVPLRRSTP